MHGTARPAGANEPPGSVGVVDDVPAVLLPDLPNPVGNDGRPRSPQQPGIELQAPDGVLHRAKVEAQALDPNPQGVEGQEA
jgi:hypothetical protein